MLDQLAVIRPGATTRSISAENFDGAKGGGARATEGTGAACAVELGPGWKISPSVEIDAGATFEAAGIDGPAQIAHMWLTTHRDHWRSLVLRAYWDGAAERGYLHAQYHRSNPLPFATTHPVLDRVEGAGKYVGTYLAWGVNRPGWWGEREVTFYLDRGDEHRTICGTGTEDYFGGAWNFDVRVDVQALGWKTGHRYQFLSDDIASTAWFSLNQPTAARPPLPPLDDLAVGVPDRPVAMTGGVAPVADHTPW